MQKYIHFEQIHRIQFPFQTIQLIKYAYAIGSMLFVWCSMRVQHRHRHRIYAIVLNKNGKNISLMRQFNVKCCCCFAIAVAAESYAPTRVSRPLMSFCWHAAENRLRCHFMCLLLFCVSLLLKIRLLRGRSFVHSFNCIDLNRPVREWNRLIMTILSNESVSSVNAYARHSLMNLQFGDISLLAWHGY